MIRHIKVWNRWRKRNLNNKFYKFLVLLGIAKSPTFMIEYGYTLGKEVV